MASGRRPALHFTPPSGWMNDPNGLVYFENEYHLFYQHNPDSTQFGPMHWGHAVSEDLVTWRHLPIALSPDACGLIYSGCVVVDWENTSGLGVGGAPPLVALFTYHHVARERAGTGDHQVQALAFSTDRGRTWMKHPGNPVLPNTHRTPDFRDPKVFWRADRRDWVMILAVGDHVALYASLDLASWRFVSAFGHGYGPPGSMWECPDLFPLTVAETGETKWVLIVSVNPGGPQGGSGTLYFIGDFEDDAFVLDPRFRDAHAPMGAAWLDWGGDHYAGVTWSDAPVAAGRRLMIGWMSNWSYAQDTPAAEWRGAMTCPRELWLAQGDGSVCLASAPAPQLERVMRPVVQRGPTGGVLRAPFAPGEVRVTADAPAGGDGEVAVELSNRRGDCVRLGYDAAGDVYFWEGAAANDTHRTAVKSGARRVAPRCLSGRSVAYRVIVDEASVELFADAGRVVMTEAFFAGARMEHIRVLRRGDARLESAQILQCDGAGP